MENETPVAQEDPPVDLELNAEVLEVLGSDVTLAKEVSGPSLQTEAAKRWLGVLKLGLSEEERQRFIDSYCVPDNCPLLAAPRLNLEVNAAINESVRRRDVRMTKIQDQIGISLCAIGQVITSLLKREGEGHLSHIKQLSDASRLLLDLHYQETNTRRDLVSLNLNKELKNTLNSAVVDGWLFGADLDEWVKATKTLEKSGQDLKPAKPKVPVRRTNVNQQLNYRRLPRPQQGVRQGGRIQPQTPRIQAQSSRNQYQSYRSQQQYHRQSNDKRTHRGRMHGVQPR